MKRVILLVAVMLVLAAAAIGLWREPASESGHDRGADLSTPAEPARSAGAAAVVDAGSALPSAARPQFVGPRVVAVDVPDSARAGSNGQLPPTDLPLRDTAAALIEAHRGGNLKATRRLMQELSDCQRHRWASLRMDMIIAFEDSPRAQRRGGERMREAMSSAAELVAELDERCANLPGDLDEALLFEVQRRAADAGDLAGQLGFALVPALSLNKALLQMDRLAVYQEQAPQFLQRALEQGSGQAVAGFMDGYEHYFEGWRGHGADGTAMQNQAMRKMIDAVRPLNPLQQVLGEDLVKAYTYASLCKQVCNATDQARAETALVRLRLALEPDQRTQAEAAAATLDDAYFGPRPRPEDIDLEELRDAILGFRR